MANEIDSSRRFKVTIIDNKATMCIEWTLEQYNGFRLVQCAHLIGGEEVLSHTMHETMGDDGGMYSGYYREGEFSPSPEEAIEREQRKVMDGVKSLNRQLQERERELAWLCCLRLK